jgi:hypothetical protein
MKKLFLDKKQDEEQSYLKNELDFDFINKKNKMSSWVYETSKPLKDNIIQWATVKAIWGEIMEITDNKVIVKCLVDEGNRIFQIRKFDITPFRGTVNLEISQYIQIKIYTRSGERKFTYRNANNDKLYSIFEPIDYFEGLENSSFFKPNNSQNENNF